MTESRRRSARIQQKVASESELSDMNTDDELSISSAKKKSRKTPKSSTARVSRRDKVPFTVPEDADADVVEVTESFDSDTEKRVLPKKRISSSSKKNPSSASKTKSDFIKSGEKAKRKILEDTVPEYIELDDTKVFCKSALGDILDNIIKKEKESTKKESTTDAEGKHDNVVNAESEKGDQVSSKYVISSGKEGETLEKGQFSRNNHKEITKESCIMLRSTSSKTKFKFNFQKYGRMNKDQSSLSKLAIQLENDTQLQSHFQQLKNKNSKNGTRDPTLGDVFGLDGMNIDKAEKEEPKIEAKLSSMTSNALLKNVMEKEVSQLMKKSVIPPDMEKNKTCPKFHESKIAKEKEKKKKAEETTGPGWYNMPRTELTDEVKRDLQILKMRGTLDNKRHYKRSDSKAFPKFFQMGTVVEGAHDFYSSRLSKKDRKRTMVDELLADAEFRKKNKQRMIDYERKKQSGGKDYYKKKMEKRKRLK